MPDFSNLILIETVDLVPFTVPTAIPRILAAYINSSLESRIAEFSKLF